jgi:hypothetical protein
MAQIEDGWKVADLLWTVVTGGVAVIWGMLHKRIDKVEASAMTHTDELRKEHEKLGQEVNRQRDVSSKIFDKLEAMSKESADRHVSLLTALHVGLAGKVDK